MQSACKVINMQIDKEELFIKVILRLVLVYNLFARYSEQLCEHACISKITFLTV